MQPQESKSNWHFKISISKSVFRLVAGMALIKGDLVYSGILLILAEILGIAEEL